MLDINELPNDVERLKQIVMERDASVQARDILLRENQVQLELLKFQLARLRGMTSGQPSEQPGAVEQAPPGSAALDAALAEADRKAQNVRRITNWAESGCTCPACSGTGSAV